MVHKILKTIWAYRDILIILLTPLILLPLPLISSTPESKCGYVIILMAVYWITEALPLAVTSLIPLILFPLLEIMKASAVSVRYFKDTNWLLIGGLIIAVAVETTGLHKRIALRVLLFVGVRPRWLMLGFMLVTFFLSMWISNTATTAMMLPIVEAIFQELNASEEDEEDHNLKTKNESQNEEDSRDVTSFSNVAFETNDENIEPIPTEEASPDVQIKLTKRKPNAAQRRNELIAKGITICIPYSASIGGTTTLTGTGPNLILSEQYRGFFPAAEPQLSFGIWITYCLPQALVALFFAYIWMSFWFIGFKPKDLLPCVFKQQKSTKREMNAERVIREQYDELGKIKWSEGTILAIFITTALLWFFRTPGFIPGWSVFFKEKYVSDGTVAITMAFLLFILPGERPNIFRRNTEGKISKPVAPILDWPTTQRMLPWNVTLLLGAGFAIADASIESGLSKWFGDQLAVLRGIEPWVICLIVTTLVCLLTECSSNTATASLFIPILAQLAVTIEIHPLYIMLPPVIAASLAFMLPVATPPNAIAFSYGRIKVIDLVKAGWVVNILGILVITLFINTYGIVLFSLSEFPQWANSTTVQNNPTTIASSIRATTQPIP